MSDFPSLADLIPSSPSSGVPVSAPAMKVSSEEVEKKFQRKMSDVEHKQREVEAMRLANTLGIPHIDLEKFPVSHKALRMLPRERAAEVGVVCFYATPDGFRLGALDPTTPQVQDILHELEERHKSKGALYVISQLSFDRIFRLYDTLPNVAPVSKDIEITEENLSQVQADVHDFSSFQELIQKQSTTDLVSIILGAGLKLDTSDIHIEAEEDAIHVRFRLDGVLHEAAQLPRTNYKRLVSRIKLVSSLKINVTENPQDGRFTIKLSTGEIDVRVSTLPTVYGESIVMRLLRQDREQLTLANLGLRGRTFELLSQEIARPNGMIVTTGPTGSGKTTTLYAIMHILNKPGVKILTLEDPVEYKMEGINQSQVDPSKDYTFAKGLRSMLRQDPDIAMVGEIRDLETAEISVQAALTGHLILTTTHTNSASGTIPRFLSMGVRPFLLAPALNTVMAQRLVRRLCQSCKKEMSISDAQQARVTELLASLPQEEQATIAGKPHMFFEAPGCEACNNLGYKGRIGIYELFLVTKEIEQLVLSGHMSEFEIQDTAVAQGMVTMVQDGVLKALDGLTSLEEVFRVTE